MARKLKIGDRVRWTSHGGTAEGSVVRIATRDGTVSGFDYRASEEDPKYIVRTDEGSEAAHNAEALRPVRE
ncbi:MAG: DUF2945 domain-containing protein [Bryobacteraceae bacterium]